MGIKSNFIEANLTKLISSYLNDKRTAMLLKDCLYLLQETNKQLQDKGLFSATDHYCQFLLPLFNFYEVNTTIKDVRNDLEEKFRRCLRFVENGYEYPEAEISVSQILDWLVDDYVTLTGQRLPIFYEFEKFRTNQIISKALCSA